MRLTPLARWGRAPTDPATLMRPTTREWLSCADYASPVTHYRHERDWRICDRFAAGVLIGVLAALALGVL